MGSLTNGRRLVFNFLTCFILLNWIQLPIQGEPLPQPQPQANQDWPPPNFSFESPEKFDSFNNFFENHQKNYIHFSTQEEDEHQNFTQMATKTIAAIVIVLVLASFVAFLICLCCPICLLAKMRQRRRGFVYQTASTNATGGATGQSGQTSVTVLHAGGGGPSNLPSHQQGIQVITTTGNARTPYPVQPSVTVMPVSAQQQQQQHLAYGHGPNPNAIPYPVPNQTAPGPYPMPMPMMGGHNHNYPNPNAPPQDLPPPYPGLPREVDSMQNSANPSQPAYNPYFNENGDNPNPYMPTTAPYPTKH